MSTTLSAGSRVVASREQVSCDLGGEAAILNLKNSVYYGLDPVGARVWTLLQQPKSVKELCDAIVQEFEVTPEQCESDLFALLDQLMVEGLVEAADGAAK